jgi:hypothetical protein
MASNVAFAGFFCYNQEDIHTRSAMRNLYSSVGYRLGLLSLILSLGPGRALAQIFNGPGLSGGVDTAKAIDGPIQADTRTVVLRILRVALDYLALAAVIMVIVAGLFLIFSLGNEEAKNKAKNIVKYVVIGLLVILFARVVVGFFTVELPGTL